MIQVSFKFALNYEWIVSKPAAGAQIFQYLPVALAGAYGISQDRVVMHSIRPYDTKAPLNYITSQALAWYPTEFFDQLRMDIKTPAAALYNQPDPLVWNLTQEINPAIDIVLGAGLDGPGTGTNGDGPGPSGPGGNSNYDPFGNGGSGDGTTGSQRGVTAGIALGAAGVAGAYGAAMFIIARRYKRKKQAHKRSSSVTSHSEMRQGGSPPLMGGALLSRDFTGTYGGVHGPARNSHGSGGSGTSNSARTANISAPVAAENSLGWN
jgi:hypothetical protein